jgi:hypothetical protein
MSLWSSRELAESKLILLYMFEKINVPVSNLQITKLILENKFMNYFDLQQFLNELCDNNFLSSEIIDDKTYYTISPHGKQTLSYFINLIPLGIKTRIDTTYNSIKKNIKDETYIISDFTPVSENEFIVSCKVREENFLLADLSILVGTRHDARSICDNWKKHSQVIYSEIIESLTKKRE